MPNLNIKIEKEENIEEWLKEITELYKTFLPQ